MAMKKIDVYNAGKLSAVTKDGKGNTYLYGSWQYKAWMDGWQAGLDELALPKTTLVKAWSMTKRERDTQKRLDATLRNAANVERFARLDKEMRATRTARGFYKNAAPISHNIKRGGNAHAR